MSSLLLDQPRGDREVPAAVKRALLTEGVETRHAAGQIIHQAGDFDRSLSLILAGRVRFRRMDPDGNEVSVGTAGRGRTFGEIPMLTGRARTHDAVAETAVRLARIPFARVQALFERDPALRDWMMAELGHLLIRALDMLDRQNRLSATQSVAHALGTCGRGRVAVRQSELAQSLNLSRKSVNRAVGVLREAGLITTGYGVIEVLDVEGLVAFAVPADPRGPEWA